MGGGGTAGVDCTAGAAATAGEKPVSDGLGATGRIDREFPSDGVGLEGGKGDAEELLQFVHSGTRKGYAD